MCITCKKTTHFVILCRVKNGEKIEYEKIFRGQAKPNTTEFPFFYING